MVIEATAGAVAETQNQVFEKMKMRLDTKGALQFFTAETGLGKTTGAQLAMKRLRDEVDEELRFLVQVPTKKDADFYWQAMENIAPGMASVWTQSHDPTENIDAVFEPSCQFTKAEAVKYRCLIVTHNAGKVAEKWVGHRDVVLIDEYPAPVSTGVVNAWQFIKARDDEGTEPFRCAATWAEEQDCQGLQPAGVPDWVCEVVTSEPSSEEGRNIKKLAEHMMGGTAFQRRIGTRTVWHWYQYDLPFEEKAIVFSATAHLEGWHFDPAQNGKIERTGIRVSYENLAAKYHPWPAGVSQYHDNIVRDPDQREALVDYVCKMVGLFDDSTLIVCPKALERDISRKVKNAKVTHWGCDIGSNEYRECSKVWLVSLFHQRADVLYSKYLGHARQPATEDSLKDGSNTQGSAGNELRRLHHSMQIKQMGARGACRNVDESGVAAPMELHCVFHDRDVFSAIVPEVFRGAELGYEDRPQQTRPRKNRPIVPRIVECLTEAVDDFVSAKDLEENGIKIRGSDPKKKIKEKPELWATQGWEFLDGSPGRYGQSAGFRRLN